MDADALRLHLIDKICRLPADQLDRVAEFVRQLNEIQPLSDVKSSEGPDWPHAPLHRVVENGTYMVTAGTYRKEHFFRDADRLSLLHDALLTTAKKFDWHLEAWAVFTNHYHFIGYTQVTPTNLREFLNELHSTTARELNQIDGVQDRRVWHNFWDKKLTFEKSYLARLHYVHQNPVKHRLVAVGNAYRWCSAAWFERAARPATVKTIYGFKIDQLKVLDDFEPLQVL